MGIRKSRAKIRYFVELRREILRSLTKKQESFATAPDNGMKLLAFIMAMRTAMAYDGIEKCGERVPRAGDEKPFHAVY
jgi:hypothetical protein